MRVLPPIPFFSETVPVYIGWTREYNLRGFPLAAHSAEYELQFIKSGQGAYYVQGKTWHFGARHLLIIKPNQVHGFIPKKSGWLEKAQVIFSRKYMREVLGELKDDRTFPAIVRLSDFSAVRVEMVINRILEENSRREKRWEEMVHALLHAFLILAVRAKNQPAGMEGEKPLLKQLRQYIEEHCSDPGCNVTRIAGRFGYSLHYLSALFKKTTGIGIKQYLLQYRILVARQTLQDDPNLKIEAVGRQAGFNNYRSFARVFVALTGFSPECYRRNCHANSKK